MALFSCVSDTIAICFCWTGTSQNKKNSLKWSMNDQMRRRRHTGKQDQGSEVRVWSLIGKNTTSFPAKFCALDSMFGALCAAAYAGEVQQGARRLLQLLVQLRLDLSPWPLIDGPLNPRRTSRSLLEASLLPEVRVLVAVEALAASTAGLPAVEASFFQGGQGWGGGAGGAALQRHAAVVVVLLRIAAHQDWIWPREVQRTVRIAWGGRKARAMINKLTKWGFTGCKLALMTHEISYLQ